jgi:hypothetical protein
MKQYNIFYKHSVSDIDKINFKAIIKSLVREQSLYS